MIKLNDYCKNNNISYITGYRWFKSGKFPVNAYQTESGTIMVEDIDQTKLATDNNNAMSLFLKKTVEFSKNNSTVEDFAAYIVSNFSLKLNSVSDDPKYSRNMPKQEVIQDHFKQFSKPKGEKPKTNMFIPSDPKALDELVAKSDDLTTQELSNEINQINEGFVSFDWQDVPEVKDLVKGLSFALATPNYNLTSNYSDSLNTTGGIVARSVDLTPQLNYTGSAPNAFSNSISSSYTPSVDTFATAMHLGSVSYISPTGTNFGPTSNELESLAKASEIVEKSKRGRKSHKKADQ